MKSARPGNSLPVPFPCLRALIYNQGPGRNKFRGETISSQFTGKTWKNTRTQSACRGFKPKERIATARPGLALSFRLPARILRGGAGTARVTIVLKLLSLFTSLLAIPLARQSCLDAFLFTGLQIVGVTLDFLDDVFLLDLPLEPAQRIFQRLAFLYTNFCQSDPTSKPANWLLLGYWKESAKGQTKAPGPEEFSSDRAEFLPNRPP